MLCERASKHATRAWEGNPAFATHVWWCLVWCKVMISLQLEEQTERAHTFISKARQREARDRRTALHGRFESIVGVGKLLHTNRASRIRTAECSSSVDCESNIQEEVCGRPSCLCKSKVEVGERERHESSHSV